MWFAAILVDECDKFITSLVCAILFCTCIWRQLEFHLRLLFSSLKIGCLQITEDLWHFLMWFCRFVLYGTGFVIRMQKIGVWHWSMFTAVVAFRSYFVYITILIYYVLLFRLLLTENYIRWVNVIGFEMVSADDVDNGELGNEVEETGENGWKGVETSSTSWLFAFRFSV